MFLMDHDGCLQMWKVHINQMSVVRIVVGIQQYQPLEHSGVRYKAHTHRYLHWYQYKESAFAVNERIVVEIENVATIE